MRRREEGAATVLVIAMAGMLMFVVVGLSIVSGLVTAQRRAQAAADLAALAGATTAATGGDPCAQAARIAAANGARLDTCAATQGDVVVRVLVPGPTWSGRVVQVRAAARAGPGQEGSFSEP